MFQRIYVGACLFRHENNESSIKARANERGIMAGKRRTRPVGTKRRAEALEPLNAPYPGCCVPYPDATFQNQNMVRLSAHHQGPRCRGYLEPIDITEWMADVHVRNANRSKSGSDE